jgi:hypothetical protein
MRTQRKGKAICGRCGNEIDPTARNQEYAIITIVKDTDAAGTKHQLSYICATIFRES